MKTADEADPEFVGRDVVFFPQFFGTMFRIEYFKIDGGENAFEFRSVRLDQRADAVEGFVGDAEDDAGGAVEQPAIAINASKSNDVTLILDFNIFIVLLFCLSLSSGFRRAIDAKYCVWKHIQACCFNWIATAPTKSISSFLNPLKRPLNTW